MSDSNPNPDSNTKVEKRGKAASASADEQLKFLLSCIRYSVNGKIDFAEVASECSIISKGAAAKRYERLMKAHNIEKKPELLPRDASVASAKVRRGEVKPGTTAAANKKRKILEAESPCPANNDDDDDEEPSLPAMKKKKVVAKGVKKEGAAAKAEVIKEEEGTDTQGEEAADIPQYDGAGDFAAVKDEAGVPGAVKMEPDTVLVKAEAVCEEAVNDGGRIVVDVEDDARMFDQFLQPGDFDRSIVIAD
ncbi:MAG: hypothetical protein Q9208_005448 [Pyrenodesmia sp. 3 TL-2023]